MLEPFARRRKRSASRGGHRRDGALHGGKLAAERCAHRTIPRRIGRELDGALRTRRCGEGQEDGSGGADTARVELSHIWRTTTRAGTLHGAAYG